VDVCLLFLLRTIGILASSVIGTQGEGRKAALERLSSILALAFSCIPFYLPQDHGVFRNSGHAWLLFLHRLRVPRIITVIGVGNYFGRRLSIAVMI
jgi:hypothetical protein